MHLFTVFLEYAGGTYATQVKATHEGEALKQWVALIAQDEEFGKIGGEVSAAFVSTDSQPIPLAGMVGAWCASATAGEGLALLNIVRTAS